MYTIKLLCYVLAIVLGATMFVYGGYDDSPGGQFLGLILIVSGVWRTFTMLREIPTNYTPLSKIMLAILISFLVNAPFALGEFLTRDVFGPRTDFPFRLFVGMWTMMSLFGYLLISTIQTWKNVGTRILLAIQLFILSILLWAWTTLIIDQWPCFFLGGSGC